LEEMLKDETNAQQIALLTKVLQDAKYMGASSYYDVKVKNKFIRSNFGELTISYTKNTL